MTHFKGKYVRIFFDDKGFICGANATQCEFIFFERIHSLSFV